MADDSSHLKAIDGGRRPAHPHIERLLELSPDMMCIAGFDGRYQWLSPGFEDVLGRTRAELMSRPLYEFLHPDDVAPSKRVFEDMGVGRSVAEFRNRYRHADGTYRWLEWRGMPDLEAKLVFGIARDVTEIERRKRLMDQAVEISGVGGWELDLADHTMLWSGTMFRLLEADPNAPPTWNALLELHEPKSRRALQDAVADASKNRRGFTLELDLRTRSGRLVRALRGSLSR